MTRDHQIETETQREEDLEPRRRTFLSTTATIAMAGGLAAGYGTFFVMAGRFFFPSRSGKSWIFVSEVDGIRPGESIPFESPAGVKVTITRASDQGADSSATEESFTALSSICPHLGCRVHWEAHNNRFFCPCHNGVFDPDGMPVSGPPAADGQQLARYPLQIIDGRLFIELPVTSVGKGA